MKATVNEFGDIYIPEGWREVLSGETIEKDDLILDMSSKVWNRAKYTIGTTLKGHDVSVVIRREDIHISEEYKEHLLHGTESKDKPITETNDAW